MIRFFLRIFLFGLICLYLMAASLAMANGPDRKSPPIVEAAKAGNLSAVRTLLDQGAHVNARDNWHRTLLIIAVQQEDLNIMQLLMSRSADVNAANKNGITALIAAVQRDNFDAIHRLVQAGAQVNQADRMGWNPLMWAVYRNNRAAVHLLVNHGADPLLTNRQGFTALDLAKRINASPEIWSLLQPGSPSNPLLRPQNDNKQTRFPRALFRPQLAASRLIRGNPKAAVTIVEYTDFQCPYCALGKEAIDDILAKYNGKVKVVVKHAPSDSHRVALPAALYFEALARRNPEKAWQFYDLIFTEQHILREGEAGLSCIIDRLGLSDQERRQLENDRFSRSILATVEADLLEAESFGFGGVPVVMVNDILLEGYYSAETFSQVIDPILYKLANG
ncbi:ankyrin repeat domain-containing protein [Acetonema longum]|uniref:Disulfide interchange protein n=1 Tax=Acetonema longum DSM 6540 TaxID=1009370 RepID=F7NGC7_9FIRM|nr:ankyrin repeat domain-containing protein [Acetonema longum]EGO64920.1 disulfide interchange protein [Acetonema longum DSM 6540]